MSRPAAATPPVAPRRRWLPRLLLAAIVLLLLLLVALRMALQPDRAVPMLLDRLGEVLGLEITASGRPELTLRGTPTLVVRGVTARQPRASKPLLQAERILLSVPWSTLRDGGQALDLVRIELDRPVVDLPALRRWLSTRPPGETRVPTLREGLRIRQGRIDAIGWRIEGVDARLREFGPRSPIDAVASGRYVDASTTVPFDLALAMTRPTARAGLALVGDLTVQRRDWRLPMRVRASGPLRVDDDGMRVAPMRLALSGAYVSDGQDLPFVLGLHGPLRYLDGVATLAPVGAAMRGQAPLPVFDGRGALALGRRLVLRLDGTMPRWPEGWPSLPPPLGASTSPVPFALGYAGRTNLADPARLSLERDGAQFDAGFRLPDVLAWIDDGGSGTPLPPLSGSASAPRLEISGAQLEGVEIVIDEPGLPAPETRR